jgi:hypothetical protein
MAELSMDKRKEKRREGKTCVMTGRSFKTKIYCCPKCDALFWFILYTVKILNTKIKAT